MLIFICKQLRPKPRFPDASPPWLIQLPHIDRNTPPPVYHYSSESVNEDGKGIPCPLKNPRSTGDAPDKVERTKTLLREYGFTNTHFSKLNSQSPRVFTSVPEKTLLSKLEFLRGIGFFNTDLPGFFCSSTALLGSSLQKQIVPCYNFLKTLFLSDSDVFKTIKLSPRLLSYSVEKRIAPNIAALREAGVPHSRILHVLRCYTVLGSSTLGESIKKATEMGFNPSTVTFVHAVKVFTNISKPTLDKKMEAYRRCGMSDEEIRTAFRSSPLCMLLSEENIVQTMDFVVKKMGWLPADLARYPKVIHFSLEKRIIPRCTVVRYLQGKGILRRSISLGLFLKNMNEKDFLDKYVNRYKNDVPELMDIYLGKISPQEPVL